MVFCCLLGSWVLFGKASSIVGEAGSGIHSHSRKAGFTQLWWNQGTICYFDCGGGGGKQQQKGPSSGALAVEHSILLPKQHLLFYKGVGVVMLTGSLSLTQLLIFESQPKGLYLLSHGEVTYFLKVPSQTID
jgi:hypothetical protein